MVNGDMRSLVISDDHDHAEVRLAVGEEVEVAVTENATTGFRWSADSDAHDVAQVVEDRFDAPTTAATGSAGTRRFVVAGRRRGDAVLTMELRRPWGTSEPARHVDVTVEVREEPAQ